MKLENNAQTKSSQEPSYGLSFSIKSINQPILDTNDFCNFPLPESHLLQIRRAEQRENKVLLSCMNVGDLNLNLSRQEKSLKKENDIKEPKNDDANREEGQKEAKSECNERLTQDSNKVAKNSCKEVSSRTHKVLKVSKKIANEKKVTKEDIKESSSIGNQDQSIPTSNSKGIQGQEHLEEFNQAKSSQKTSREEQNTINQELLGNSSKSLYKLKANSGTNGRSKHKRIIFKPTNGNSLTKVKNQPGSICSSKNQLTNKGNYSTLKISNNLHHNITSQSNTRPTSSLNKPCMITINSRFNI